LIYYYIEEIIRNQAGNYNKEFKTFSNVKLAKINKHIKIYRI